MMKHLLSSEQWVDLALQAGLFLILFVAAYLALGARRKRARHFKWLFILTNSLLLTMFTVGCSANYPVLLATQAELTDVLHRLRNDLNRDQSIENILGNNQLLLVDVSHDLALVPDSSVTAIWQGRQVITDRRKLTRFLTLLGRDSVNNYVHTVVCDLIFGSASDIVGQDADLKQALDRLQDQEKLLLAQSQLADNKEVNGKSAIDANEYRGGLVDITTYHGGYLFDYQLFADSTGRYEPSLPYALYSRQRGLPTVPIEKNWLGYREKNEDGTAAWVTSKFVPEFWFDNADVGYEVQESSPGSLWQWLTGKYSRPDSSMLFETTGWLQPYFYRLGQLTNDSLSTAVFLNQLRANRRAGIRSVVFIGLFDGNERDMHQTLVGSMHGSLVLLNVFLNLLNGSHRISLAYILYLLGSFAIVSGLQLYKTHRWEPHFYQHNYEKWWHILGRMVVQGLFNILNFILEEKAYLATLLLLILAVTFFNHLINIVMVELYLGITSLLLNELYYTKPAQESLA